MTIGECTQNTLPGAWHSTFFLWAHTAHSVAPDKVVCVSFTVIPHGHSHLVSLMS